jgi:hypothetical protein
VTTPALTLSEAVEATGASLSTLRRRLRSGAFPGAFTDEDGTHRVPVADLLGAGFQLDRVEVTTPDHPQPDVTTGSGGGHDHPSDHPVTTLLTTPTAADEEVQRLRDEVTEWRERANRAEVEAARAQAVADERAAALADVRLALRAITAATEQQREQQPQRPTLVVHEVPAGPPTDAPAPAEPKTPRRRWWPWS